MGEPLALRASDHADLRQATGERRRRGNAACKRIGANRQRGILIGRRDQRPVRGRRLVHGGLEIVTQSGAKRRLIAARDADRVDRPGPRPARLGAEKARDRARLRLQPLRGAFGFSQRPATLRLDLTRLGVALFGGQSFALGGGERLGGLGEDLRARRVFGLLKTRRAERVALALDSGIFRFQAREAPPLLFEGDEQRAAASSEVGRGGLGFRKRALGAGEATLSVLLRFPRLNRVLVRAGSLLRQRSLLGCEPVHDAGRIRDQRFLALKIAGELRDATVKFRLALLRALLFRFERFAGERDAVQGRAATSFLLAQGRQGCSGERLQTRGLGLRARALSDFEEVGVEPPTRLGERRLMFAPGDETGQRLVTADRASQFAVAVRLARLTLETVDLGVDLLQHILDADEIVLGALQPKLGFVAPRVEAGDARGFLKDQAARLGLGGNDLADLALAYEGGRSRSRRRVGEQELHVTRPHLLAVDAVGRTGVAFNAPRDLDGLGIIESGGGAAVRVAEYEPDLRVVARGSPA